MTVPGGPGTPEFIARAFVVIAALFIHLFWWLITLLPVYALRLYKPTIALSRQLEQMLYGLVAQLFLWVIQHKNYTFKFSGNAAPGAAGMTGVNDPVAILISNHISDADPFLVLHLAFRYGVHGMSSRCLVVVLLCCVFSR